MTNTAECWQEMEKKYLTELLEFIQGKGAFSHWGEGIFSYFGRDENNDKIHEGCLELEKQQLIYRHLERADYVVWMPKPSPINDE